MLPASVRVCALCQGGSRTVVTDSSRVVIVRGFKTNEGAPGESGQGEGDTKLVGIYD